MNYLIEEGTTLADSGDNEFMNIKSISNINFITCNLKHYKQNF